MILTTYEILFIIAGVALGELVWYVGKKTSWDVALLVWIIVVFIIWLNLVAVTTPK